MSDLATIRGRVQLDVDDTGAVVFTTNDIDRGIRRALREYSVKLPQIKESTLTVSTAGRVQSISSLTGLIDVLRVWFPYEATEVDALPAWVPAEVLVSGSLIVYGQTVPAVGDVIKVWYSAWHTIKGLDSATVTTLPDVDEDLIALGAAGYACQAQARGAVGVVNVSGYTPVHWRTLAEGLLSRFEAGLYALVQAAAMRAGGVESMTFA